MGGNFEAPEGAVWETHRLKCKYIDTSVYEKDPMVCSCQKLCHVCYRVSKLINCYGRYIVARYPTASFVQRDRIGKIPLKLAKVCVCGNHYPNRTTEQFVN